LLFSVISTVVLWAEVAIFDRELGMGIWFAVGFGFSVFLWAAAGVLSELRWRVPGVVALVGIASWMLKRWWPYALRDYLITVGVTVGVLYLYYWVGAVVRKTKKSAAVQGQEPAKTAIYGMLAWSPVASIASGAFMCVFIHTL